MDSPAVRRSIRLYFDVSVLLKGLVSLAEVLGGLLVLFVPVPTITTFVVHVAQTVLSDEPGDFIAMHLTQVAQQLALTSSTFIAVYLLSRGLIKLLLVVALLKNKLWAYPSSLVVLGLFVLYQIYQFIIDHSLLIALLTVFDLIVMYFIWREYIILRDHPELLGR